MPNLVALRATTYLVLITKRFFILWLPCWSADYRSNDLRYRKKSREKENAANTKRFM